MPHRDRGRPGPDPDDRVLALFTAVFMGAGSLAALGTSRMHRGESGLPLSPFLSLLVFAGTILVIFRTETALRATGRLPGWWFTVGAAHLVIVGAVLPFAVGSTFPITVLPTLGPRPSAALLWVPMVVIGAVFCWRSWQFRRRS